MVPSGTSADHFRKVTLEHFDMSLGSGLSKVADKVFRIGHLGDFNDLMLMGTLSGVEMGLELSGIPYRRGGVQAALGYLCGQADRKSVVSGKSVSVSVELGGRRIIKKK